MSDVTGVIVDGPVTVSTARVRQGDVLNLRPGERVIYHGTETRQQHGTWHTFIILTPLEGGEEPAGIPAVSAPASSHEHAPDLDRWVTARPGGLLHPSGDAPRSLNPCTGCDAWLPYGWPASADASPQPSASTP